MPGLSAFTARDYLDHMLDPRNEAELMRRVEPLNEMLNDPASAAIDYYTQELQQRWAEEFEAGPSAYLVAYSLLTRCAGNGILMYAAVAQVNGRPPPSCIPIKPEDLTQRHFPDFMERYDVSAAVRLYAQNNLQEFIDLLPPLSTAQLAILEGLCVNLFSITFAMALICCEEL